MSLINDMLRDLEQRREQDKQQTPVSSPSAVTRKPVPQRLTLMVGALVLVLLMLLVAGWAYYLPKDVAAPLNLVAPVADDESLVEMTTVEPLALQDKPSAVANPLLTSVVLTENAQQLQLELSFDLLPPRVEIRSKQDEGQVLIRLPDTHLQQGLVIAQPRNEHIKTISLVPTSAGLDVIVAIAAGQHIATSQQVEPHSATLVVGLDFLAAIPSSVEDTEAPAGQTVTASVALPPVSVTKPNVTAPAITPAVTATLVRTQPAPQTDEQLYRRGLQQVRQGDLRAAQESFSGSLRINPQLLAARLELIGVLQRLTLEQDAVLVIQEGLQQQPAQPELRKLLAHHLLSAQHYQDALMQLETAPVPAVAADPDYHALRAALYQELSDYPQAGLLYAQLLEQRPREPLWWMGLAIALDQQGLADGARDAYRTALDVSGLRPDLEQFVRKRLQHL